jgi:hypothetical protein
VRDTYTRNYRLQKGEPPKNAPVTEISAEKHKENVCDEVCEAVDTAPCSEPDEANGCTRGAPKCRYRAVRVPILKDKDCGTLTECEASCEAPCEAPCECVEKETSCQRQSHRGGLSPLFSSLSTDEMLVLALVVLLLLEGGDELLIFALLFVLT